MLVVPAEADDATAVLKTARRKNVRNGGAQRVGLDAGERAGLPVDAGPERAVLEARHSVGKRLSAALSEGHAVGERSGHCVRESRVAAGGDGVCPHGDSRRLLVIQPRNVSWVAMKDWMVPPAEHAISETG